MSAAQQFFLRVLQLACLLAAMGLILLCIQRTEPLFAIAALALVGCVFLLGDIED